jgi:Fic family protein
VFQQILALRADVEKRILTLGKRVPNASATLHFLYRKPVIDAAELEAAIKVSKPTAQSLVQDFQKLHILTETTGQMRDRIYCFEPYLKLFIS